MMGKLAARVRATMDAQSGARMMNTDVRAMMDGQDRSSC